MLSTDLANQDFYLEIYLLSTLIQLRVTWSNTVFVENIILTIGMAVIHLLAPSNSKDLCKQEPWKRHCLSTFTRV